jgi:hypothetical protein
VTADLGQVRKRRFMQKKTARLNTVHNALIFEPNICMAREGNMNQFTKDL